VRIRLQLDDLEPVEVSGRHGYVVVASGFLEPNDGVSVRIAGEVDAGAVGHSWKADAGEKPVRLAITVREA
jgi:hypothetical protein